MPTRSIHTDYFAQTHTRNWTPTGDVSVEDIDNCSFFGYHVRKETQQFKMDLSGYSHVCSSVGPGESNHS